MREIIILTDSIADLPINWLLDHPNFKVIDTPIIVSPANGEPSVFNNLGADDFTIIDDYISRGARVTTSQPLIFGVDDDPDSVEGLTKNYLRDGKDVVYITISSSISGTYNTASLCFSQLEDFAKEQGGQIRCIDSECASTGLALLLIELADAMRGKRVETIDEIESFICSERGHIGHFFTWAKLDYIKLSGRVNGVQSAIANLLHLRLMCSLQYKEDGTRTLEHVNPKAIIKGPKGWANALAIYIKRHLADPTGPIIVAYGNADRDARIIADTLKSQLPLATILSGPDWRCSAGIQAHGGPTSIHVNFRTNNIGTLKSTIAEMESIIRKR